MKKSAVLIVVYLLTINCLFAQNRKESKISVLLFGTFHFAQTGADDDMLSEKRQKEITELVNKLYKFKPDKIFIERNPEFEYTNKINGHIPILKHLFESNPAFKVENTIKWLK